MSKKKSMLVEQGSASFNLSTYKIPTGKVLILRSCESDMTSYGGFVWPVSGYVEAPDFKDTKSCGNGLHGFLKGEGDGSLGSFDIHAKWLICEVEENQTIELSGKVKFKSCEVIFCGCQKDASDIMMKLYPECKIIGGTASAGDRGTATAGYRGTATAGDSGVLIIEWYDSINSCYNKKIALVGENGIKPNIKYKLDSDNNFKEVSS